jgi:hypothetical protein
MFKIAGIAAEWKIVRASVQEAPAFPGMAFPFQ